MKVLVTGGAGFIGKYLVKSLLEKGNSVTIFDNFSNSTKNSINFLVNTGVKVIEGDIRKLDDIVNAIKDQEIVIHLAAKISVSESISNPLDTFQVNVEGTKNILTACEKNNTKKLIVASSAAVYGEGTPNVKLIEKSELNPISPYGQSKLKMELVIKEFESKHNINCIVLRFFNIFGIGQSPEYAGVITKFIEKITQGKPLEIFGDGMQTRDFVAIEDVISSIHNSIKFGKSGTYNIASGKSCTIKNLVESMILFSGKKLEVRHMVSQRGDIRNSQASIYNAEKDLKYFPKFRLDRIKKLLE
jgi:UDP-glucose 4-epimerase